MGNDATMHVERACTTVYSVLWNKSRNPGACSDTHKSIACISGILVDLKFLLQLQDYCCKLTHNADVLLVL